MKRISIVGACLVMLTISLSTAVAALAEELPDFHGTEKVGVGFTTTSGEAVFENMAKVKVKCSGSSGKGTIEPPKAIKAVFYTFTGCKSVGINCTSEAEAAGTIKTNELQGKIGYLNEAKKLVGVELKAALAGKPLAEFKCSTPVVLSGCIIGGEITPINMFTSKFALPYTVGTNAGEQKWTAFENGAACEPKSSINGENALKTSLHANVEMTTAEEVELVA